MSSIDLVDICRIGQWFDLYCRTGDFESFEGRILVTYDPKQRLNGYDLRVRSIKGQICSSEAMKGLFETWKRIDEQPPGYAFSLLQ
tara:strand:- start:1324 stop:1581 length:258 start_codon:yes stop_codon:yes gene_type:complete